MFEIFNVSLTNDVVSFEQPGPGVLNNIHSCCMILTSDVVPKASA